MIRTVPDSAREIRKDLRRRILAQEWETGRRLPGERVLALEYGVSRPVIREALSALTSDRLVTISPARGAFVSVPDGSALTGALASFITARRVTVRDVADARAVIEGAALARASGAATAQQLDHLEMLATRIDTGTDRVEQAVSDLAFRHLTCVAAGNPVLAAMHRAISPQILMMVLRERRDPEGSSAGHAQIVDALRGHDHDTAAALLKIHLQETEIYFGAGFDRPVDEVAAENLARISGGFADVERVVGMADARLDDLPTAP